MKFLTLAAVLSVAISEASAHYIFQRLAVGSQMFGVFEHIRKNTKYNSPVTDLASKDLRCSEGGGSGAQTTVTSVKPRDTFSFTLDTAVYHQGPISLFLSKAPSHVQDYDGSGKWAKFKDFGPPFSNGQGLMAYVTYKPPRKLVGNQPQTPAETYEYKIPTCLPNGEYLLRIQSLAIHNPWPAGLPQFHISCAQIKLTGSSASSFHSDSRHPRWFQGDRPRIYSKTFIYSNFNSYEVPGGKEWTC